MRDTLQVCFQSSVMVREERKILNQEFTVHQYSECKGTVPLVAVIDALCERITQWGYGVVAIMTVGKPNNAICLEAK